MTDANSDDDLRSFIVDTERAADKIGTAAQKLNYSERLYWPLRERVRKIEGLANRISEDLIELTDKAGFEDLIEDLWPDPDN